MTILISSEINSLLLSVSYVKKDNLHCPKSCALKEDPKGHEL